MYTHNGSEPWAFLCSGSGGVRTRFPHTIASGFDSIRVGRENCRILEIRPLNYKQMQADLSAAKKERG